MMSRMKTRVPNSPYIAAPFSYSFSEIDFRLQEQEQVVAAAGLGVGARHVEAAERMDADQRAGALAVQVEVADEELLARALRACSRLCE